MKLEDVKVADDIERYIEGCINDIELAICDKDETIIAIAELVVYIYKQGLKESKY
jgi:hypothetical protein